MIVVLSLSIRTFLAWPRSARPTFSSSMPERLEDRLAAGQDGDVLEHRLAAVAVAGGLHRGAPEGAAELVDDQGGQRLALDVLGDDQERLARLRDLLQDRHEVLDRRDLLLVDQDVGVLEDGLHRGRVGDEVGAEVAAVELHPLDPLDLGLERLALLDRDHAVLADLLGGLGDHLADLGVEVRGDGGDLLGLLLVGDLGAHACGAASTMSATALSIPRFMSIGLTPATTAWRPSL